MFFKKPKPMEFADRVEERFQAIIELIKDLDKKEFNRLKEGIDLAWEAYNKVKQARPAAEKEDNIVDEIAKKILSDEE